MVRYLDEFKEAQSFYNFINTTECEALKTSLFSCINNMRKFVKDVIDIRDTYYAIEKENPEYAKKLWAILSEDSNINMNSYWGFNGRVKGNYYFNITATPKGICIYYDPDALPLSSWDKLKLAGDNAESYIITNKLPAELLKEFISSAFKFNVDFPKYRDKFFDAVQHPKF